MQAFLFVGLLAAPDLPAKAAGSCFTLSELQAYIS